MTVYLCNTNHPAAPERRERCVRNWGHDGEHAFLDGENIDDPRPAGIIHHQASQGLPWLTITHKPHACAWCDAERWRKENPEE